MTTLEFLKSRYGSFPTRHFSGEVKWDHWDLLYLHNGEIFIHFKDREINLKQGYALIIPPEHSFSIENRGTVASASVQYFIPRSDSPLAHRLSYQRNPHMLPRRGDINLDSHINELMEIYAPDMAVTRRQELLIELIIEKMLFSHRKNEPAMTIWDKMIEKYKDNAYRIPSMEELSVEAGYSPSRFRTLFRQHTGIPPARFFKNLRLERSALLLRETAMPIKSIAYRCGYGEVSHFNRAFSKHYSQSPGRYRKNNRLMG